METILLALQQYWPSEWEERVTIIPSDCSHECFDVRVYNQFTREWSSLGLDDFLSCRCFLNQAPLDKLEAAGKADPIRGTTKASYGVTTDMCRRRGIDESDLGLAAPNISANNGDNDPKDTYGPFSRLCERLGVSWADKAIILGDPARKYIFERFTSNPSLCPRELENRVNSFTHARIKMLELDEGQPGFGRPSYVTRDLLGLDGKNAVAPSGSGGTESGMGDAAKDASLLAGKFLGHCTPTPNNANALKAHVDAHNPAGSEVVGWSHGVLHGRVLYRDSFIMYDRKSLAGFADQMERYGPKLEAIRQYVSNMPHPSLRSPTLARYNYVLGDRGLVLLVEARTGRLISCATKTTPALNKTAAFLSALSFPIWRLHKKYGLSLFQILVLLRLCSTVNTVFGLSTVLSLWYDEGLPTTDLVSDFEERVKKMFGGHSIGPAHRCMPFFTKAWNKHTLGNDILTLGRVIEAEEVKMARLRESVRVMPTSQLQAWAEDIMSELRRVPGIGGLSAQHCFGVALQLGTLTNARLYEFSGQAATSSAVYAGTTYTPTEMRALLLAVSSALGLTSAQGENASCEATRKKDVTDLAMANTCFIGNPRQLDGFGPANFGMQMMRLDTGEWEPLPPVVPRPTGKTLLEEVKANILSNQDMPTTIEIKHPEEVKAAALEAYYVVEVEPMRSSNSYESCVAAIAAFQPDERHCDTMARCQVALERHLGCPLSDKAAVLRASGRGRKRRARRADRRRAARVTRSNPAGPFPVPNGIATGVPTGACPGTSRTPASGPGDSSIAEITPVRNHLPPNPSSVPVMASAVTGEVFEATRPPGIISMTQIIAACCGTTTLELYGQATVVLKAAGVLPVGAKNLCAKDVSCVEANWRHPRRGSSVGFYSTCPRLGLDYSQYSGSIVATSISRDLFGGLKILDNDTLSEKLVFKSKGISVRCFLFLVFLLQGRRHNASVVDMVSRLFSKTKETKPWGKDSMSSLRLQAQGYKDCCLGYLVVKGGICWYVYETPETTNSKRPQLQVLKLAENDPSTPRPPSKRTSRRLARSSDKRARLEDSGAEVVSEWDSDSWAGDESSIEGGAQNLLALFTDAVGDLEE